MGEAAGFFRRLAPGSPLTGPLVRRFPGARAAAAEAPLPVALSGSGALSVSARRRLRRFVSGLTFLEPAALPDPAVTLASLFAGGATAMADA